MPQHDRTTIGPSPAPKRAALPFRQVNRADQPGFDPGLQRHHLLPRQLLVRRCFARLFEAVGAQSVGFDDFRRNGLLLPARESGALRMGLPLHRGPHIRYNGVVIDRVGEVERTWAQRRIKVPDAARAEAAMRLSLIQRALRRRLLDTRRRLMLSRFDPLANGVDFGELDALADALWGEIG